MNLLWIDSAWDDYLYWQKTDKKLLKRINMLLKEIKRQPFEGLGKPELLTQNLFGYWSRRIDLTHRLIYEVADNTITVVQCRYHY